MKTLKLFLAVALLASQALATQSEQWSENAKTALANFRDGVKTIGRTASLETYSGTEMVKTWHGGRPFSCRVRVARDEKGNISAFTFAAQTYDGHDSDSTRSEFKAKVFAHGENGSWTGVNYVGEWVTERLLDPSTRLHAHFAMDVSGAIGRAEARIEKKNTRLFLPTFTRSCDKLTLTERKQL